MAEKIPDDLHFFRKYQDSEYLLITDTFRERWKAAGLTGMLFGKRWDGKQVLPKVKTKLDK